MLSGLQFDLNAAPAVVPATGFIATYDGCTWHAPPDAVEVMKKFLLVPPLSTLTASAIALDIDQGRPRMVDENGKLDVQAHKILKQMDRLLDYSSLHQAYTVFFAILEQLFENQEAFKVVADRLRAHVREMDSRYSERAARVLVDYDCRRREAWFRDFKVEVESAGPTSRPRLPPFPPLDEAALQSCAQAYKLSTTDLLDIHRLGDGLNSRLLRFAQEVYTAEKDKRVKVGDSVSRLERESRDIHIDRLRGSWSPSTFPPSLTLPSDYASLQQ